MIKAEWTNADTLNLQPTCNQLATDCISRQAAIDAMMTLQAKDDEAYGCHIPEGFDGERAKEALEQLPSAQPMQANASNTLNALDCVSRVQALNNIKSLYPEAPRINFMDNLAQWKKKYSQYMECERVIENLPSAQPEIVRCKNCKHNPKYEWFGCPMSHLSEAQRPETAWCWRAERRTDE